MLSREIQLLLEWGWPYPIRVIDDIISLNYYWSGGTLFHLTGGLSHITLPLEWEDPFPSEGWTISHYSTTTGVRGPFPIRRMDDITILNYYWSGGTLSHQSDEWYHITLLLLEWGDPFLSEWWTILHHSQSKILTLFTQRIRYCKFTSNISHFNSVTLRFLLLLKLLTINSTRNLSTSWWLPGSTHWITYVKK